MSERFASRSDEDIGQLLEEKDSQSTKTNTKLAINLLKQFCSTKRLGFEEQCFEKSKLDGLLKSFYANVRKKDGSFYSKNSLNSKVLTFELVNNSYAEPNYPITKLVAFQLLR